MDKPIFVYRDGMLSDKNYVAWLSDVKARFRKSQIKASVQVNTSMLQFYLSVGRDLKTRLLQTFSVGRGLPLPTSMTGCKHIYNKPKRCKDVLFIG